MLNVEVPLFRVRNGLRVVFKEKPAPKAPPAQQKNHGLCPGAHSLALGHRLVRAVEQGEARDFTDLARGMKVTQARISVLVALTFLAPDIQEELLQGGSEVAHLTSHHLLLVARMRTWVDQRRFWDGLRGYPMLRFIAPT